MQVNTMNAPDDKIQSSTELVSVPAETSGLNQINERDLMRKVDLRLIPILFLVYVAAFLDRVNISNALTMGLPKDLHLTKNQPNIALAIFFVPYVLFEIPSNILLKKLSPHVWTCTILFGVVMLAQGFGIAIRALVVFKIAHPSSVKSFGGLVATRFLLGLAESGIFPGCFYLISFWYKREESQKRFTVFWCSVVIAGAFGGLLATAISNMNGVAGLRNWRWIFILEGICTVIIGAASFFFITDFPDQARWLSEAERDFVKLRAGHEEAHHQSATLKDIVWFFKDPKRVLGALMYWGVIVPIYSYSYFAPTIIKTLGFDVLHTQLRSVIPFAAALVICLVVAWISDWARVRLPFVAFSLGLAVIGLSILMTVHHNFPVQFGALCLVAMGSFAAGVSIVCWYVMNLHGHLERSIGTAWMISFGNTGGILATFTFLAQDAPLYKRGYRICMGAICLTIVSTIAYASLILWARRNSRIKSKVQYSL